MPLLITFFNKKIQTLNFSYHFDLMLIGHKKHCLSKLLWRNCEKMGFFSKDNFTLSYIIN